jgi:uncharacterized coiled-coil protein SlyX
MSGTDTLTAFEQRLHKMEQHIQEQDAEMYRLSKRVDQLVNALKIQKLQVQALAEGGAGGADTMPANEKPPHY